MKDPSEEMTKKERFTFNKEERLCSKVTIEKLFTEGSSFLVYPFKVVYINIDNRGKFPAKAAFAVSKKLHKKAVTRNLIKRRTREAFRLNKHRLMRDSDYQQRAIIFIYISKELLQFPVIEKAMIRILEKLKKEPTRNP